MGGFGCFGVTFVAVRVDDFGNEHLENVWCVH